MVTLKNLKFLAMVNMNKAKHILSLIYGFFPHSALAIVREAEECYAFVHGPVKSHAPNHSESRGNDPYLSTASL